MFKRLVLLAVVVFAGFSASGPTQVRELPFPPCWPCDSSSK